MTSLQNKKMTEDFLLEIGTEPIPARFLFPALEQLRSKLEEGLKGHRLEFKSIRSFGTPKRLAILIEGVALKSLDLSEKFYGPPASRLKNPDGSYSTAADGFARKYNTTPDKLFVETTAKGEQLAVLVERPGQKAAEILEKLCLDAISSLDFPKSMEWEESRFRFARPIRSFVSLLGPTPVSFTLAGIKSGRKLKGLNGAVEKILNAEDYEKVLRNMMVLVDPDERKKTLVKKLDWAAAEGGGDWDKDEELLDEIIAMTEHPVCVVGHFDKKFLDLPEALIILVLKKQLKFFPLSRGGKLINSFIGVRDGVSEGQNLVKDGFERVLTARLSDAVFFFARDRKLSLDSYLEELERVTYQKDLGTMAEKAVRVQKLAQELFQSIGKSLALREESLFAIARLCYVDLTTGLVKEFPELQGTLGGVYARLEGKDERIALGLEEFYFPLNPKAPIPTTDEGCIVSLAGKLESIAGCFAAGLVPTGSADPYALRRQAFGVIRIALERQFPLDLERAVYFALKLQPISLEGARFDEVLGQIQDFIWGRAQSFFEEKGFASDEIRSIKSHALKNLSRSYLRLSAVKAARREPDFEPLANSFKRASNILKQARYENGDGVLSRVMLKDPAEIALYEVLFGIENDLQEKITIDDFEGTLKSLVTVKPHLDLFFEKVMVMVEDPAIKQARLQLLGKMVRLFKEVADLSEIQVASSK